MRKFNNLKDFTMRDIETKNIFNEQNTAKIDDMKHIAIMNSSDEAAKKIMTGFKPMFPVGNFVQPSPLGATFFHVGAKHMEPELALKVETAIFKALQNDIPIDLFIITAETIDSKPEELLEYIRSAKGISPETQMLILSYNPRETAEMLKSAGLGIEVNEGDILSRKDIMQGNDVDLFYRIKQKTGITDTPYIDDKLEYYKNAANLRDQYLEMDSIQTPTEMINRVYLEQKALHAAENSPTPE